MIETENLHEKTDKGGVNYFMSFWNWLRMTTWKFNIDNCVIQVIYYYNFECDV